MTSVSADLNLSVGPSLEEIEKAHAVVSQVAKHTPVESSTYLSELLDTPVLLKCENLQRTGSYKIRGAYYMMSKLSAEERARGVVAASAGNHAQGVAFAARELGVMSTIFMPLGVALPKLQATRGYGAHVVLGGATVEEPLRAAAEFAADSGAVFVPPFDHPDVIAGQGALGLDVLADVPDVDTVIVPIGGGGLIAGVASAVKKHAAREGRSIRVIGVQAANAAAYPGSLRAGEPTQITIEPTIADGIAVGKPGTLNFEIVKELVDEVVTVSEADIARAILVLLERAKLVVEPAGAVGVAGIVSGAVQAVAGELGTTVVILSGGNIDPLLMQRVVAAGLSISDRYLNIRLMLPDRPGQLARTSELIAAANANVVEVLHTRQGHSLELGHVELVVSIETRGSEHKEEVVRILREGGYDPIVD
jgi:threonine dehydratase